MLHIVCVAYGRPIEMQILVLSFLAQKTSFPWTLHIVYDGPAPCIVRLAMANFIDDPRILFYESEERYQQYGHPNRKRMLEENFKSDAGDWILMTNDDNFYVPVFVERMMRTVSKRTGMIFCDTVHSHMDYDLHSSKLHVDGIDMGAFIVRMDIAKTVGFNSMAFNADSIYAEEVSKYCDKYGWFKTYVKKPLFIHN